MTPTTVAMDVSPEAADRISELGIQDEVDRMIDHAMKTVQGVKQVVISLEPPNDMYDEPYLSARAYRDLTFWSEDNPDADRFRRWKTESFSPDVLSKFGLFLRWDAPHAG